MIPDSDDPRDLASEARHGASHMRSRQAYRVRGWVDGLGWEGVVQIAKILAGRGQPPSYTREWREPDWPIYVAAVCASREDAVVEDALVAAIATAVDREERLIRSGSLPNMAADRHVKSWGEGARFVLGLLLSGEGGYELWDVDSGNVVGAADDLRALVEMAYDLGRANPDLPPRLAATRAT